MNRAVCLKILASLAVLALACLPGCGKKGMPRPPDTIPPSAVCHLDGVKEHGRARLTWSQAPCRPGGRVEGFYVYMSRERTDKPQCPNCPRGYQMVATVHVGKPDLWQTGADKAVHLEPMQEGFRYYFKVVAFGPGGNSPDTAPVIVE